MKLQRFVQIGIFVSSVFALGSPSLPAAEVSRSGAHVFYSSFWINLHERLRHEAGPDAKDVHHFADADQKIWDDVVQYYHREIIPKHPIFSADLVQWQRKIAQTPDNAEPSGIPDELRNALIRAARVYKQQLWKSDDSANRFWIAVESTLLREAGPEISHNITIAYGITWPESLHIEVTPYADPFGGYTPASEDKYYLTVIASQEPGYQGFGGLEMLFHEPLHHFDDQLDTALQAASKQTNLPIPRNLDHAILFYTAGEFTRQALLERGVVYTTASSEVAHRAWPSFVPALENYWQSYLDGKIGKQEALEQILKALSTKQ